MITDDELKKILGQRIRQIRQEKGLSRAAVCGDETYVSTRQLARIEQGEHLLKVSIALYLSDVFQVSVERLLNPVPESYYDLLDRVIRFTTQGDRELMLEKERLISELYDYYNLLPQQDQEMLNLLDVTAQLIHSGSPAYGEEYFADFNRRKIQTQETVSKLDLLWFDFYFVFISIDESRYRQDKFQEILSLLSREELAEQERVVHFLHLKTLISAGNVLISEQLFAKLPLVLNVMKILLLKLSEVQYKYAYYFFEAKYAYQVEGDRQKALLAYDKALQEAQFLGNERLYQLLLSERDGDLF